MNERHRERHVSDVDDKRAAYETTARQQDLVLCALGNDTEAITDLAVLLCAARGIEGVTKDEVRGALERSLVGLLDARAAAWKAAR